MNRPNKLDYPVCPSDEPIVEFKKYTDDLEKYCDVLEKALDIATEWLEIIDDDHHCNTKEFFKNEIMKEALEKAKEELKGENNG